MSDETENAADDVLEAKFAALTTRARRTCRELSWTFYTVSEVQPHNKVNVLVAKNNERIGNDGSAQRVDDDKQNCDDDVVCREGGGGAFGRGLGLGENNPLSTTPPWLLLFTSALVWAFRRLGVWAFSVSPSPYTPFSSGPVPFRLFLLPGRRTPHPYNTPA